MDAPPPAAAPPTSTARGVVSVLAWLAVLLMISVAGAGLILSLDHAPTEDARPELTARGHALVAPRLAAMAPDIEALAATGDAVAAAGRDTLTRLRALDVAATDEALLAGDAAVAQLGAVRDRLVIARATLLDGTSLDRLPAADREHVQAIDAAILAAAALPGEWQAIVAAAGGPRDLLASLAAHDELVISATDHGRASEWAAALRDLDAAAAPLIGVRTVREVAANAGADVSTLDDLLDRVETYDAALIELYSSLRASGGESTEASRAAEAAVAAAQASLPDDQTALVVVISDLAGPTITPVLLRIETTRGALEAALDPRPEASDPGASLTP